MKLKGGLKEEDRTMIMEAIGRYGEIEKAVLFGSRAKGNYKHGSDVDISISGANVSYDTVVELRYWLNEETNMSYHFDIVHLETIKNKELKEHIQRAGIILFERKNKGVSATDHG